MHCQTLGVRTAETWLVEFDGVHPEMVERFQKTQQELKTVAERIFALLTSKPHLIPGRLNESDIPPDIIRWPIMRTYVVRCFNTLADQNALALLEDRNDGSLLSAQQLRPLEEEYWTELTKNCDQEMGMEYPSFQKSILPLLRTLANRRLTDLCLHVLKQKREGLEYQLSRDVERIGKEHSFFVQKRALMNRKAEDFAPSDFSFIPYDVERRIYSEAYAIVEKERAWDLFRLDPPSREMDFTSFCLWHPQLHRIVNLMDAKLMMSGGQMSFALGAMRDIAKKGWRAYVQDRLDSYKAEVAQLAHQ